MKPFIVREDIPLPMDRIAQDRRQGGYPFDRLTKKGQSVDMEPEHFSVPMATEERLRRVKNAAREHSRTKGGKLFVEIHSEEHPDIIRIWQTEDVPQ